MKHTVLIVPAIVLSLIATAQIPAALKKSHVSRSLTKEYFVFEKAGKSGIVDKSGVVLLPAVYNAIYTTQFDLFVAENDLGYGVVDKKNRVVLPFGFEAINILSPRRMHVQKNGFPMIFSSSNRFLADTTEPPGFLFQQDGGMFTPPRLIPDEEVPQELAANYFLKTDNAVFVITEKDTLKTLYEEVQSLTREGNFFKFRKNNRWGITDDTGKELVAAIYDDLYEDYNTRLIIVSAGKKRSLLDEELNPLAVGPFEELSHFNRDGIAIVSQNEKTRLINKQGETVAGPVNGTIREYGSNLFHVQYSGTSAMDIIDKNGESILPPGTSATAFNDNIILLATPEKKMGVLHASGILLLQPVYDEVFFSNTDGEDNYLFHVRKGNKWGVADLDEKQVVPYQYDRIYLFSNGYAPAVLNGKGGAITDKNKIVVPFIYDETAYAYSEPGLLRVARDKKYGFVDKKGAVVIPLIYDYADEEFEGGLSMAKKNGKWGYLDRKGKEVIPFEYDEAFLFSGDTTKVKKGGIWYEIDKTGKILGQVPD